MDRFSKFLSSLINRLYIAPFRKVMPLQVFRYAVVGAFNTGLSWVLFYLIFHYVVGEDDVTLGRIVLSGHIVTQIVVFVIITLTGFWLNSKIAFRNSPLSDRTQLMRYILSVCGSWAINIMVLKTLVDFAHFYPTPAFVVATLVVTVYSYLMQKYFTFRGCEEV